MAKALYKRKPTSKHRLIGGRTGSKFKKQVKSKRPLIRVTSVKFIKPNVFEVRLRVTHE